MHATSVRLSAFTCVWTLTGTARNADDVVFAALVKVQDSVAGVTTWANEATAVVQTVLEQPPRVKAIIAYMDASVDQLVGTVGIQLVADQGNALKEVLVGVQEQYDDLSASFDSVNETVASLSGMVSGGGDQAMVYLTKYEGMRSLAVKVTFSGLLGLIMLQGVIALSDIYCPDGRRPNQQKCIAKCAAPIFSGIFLFVMFVMWILGFLFYLLTAVTSDVCVQPNLIIDQVLAGAASEGSMMMGGGGTDVMMQEDGRLRFARGATDGGPFFSSGSSSIDDASGLEGGLDDFTNFANTADDTASSNPIDFFFKCNTYTAAEQVSKHPLQDIFGEIDAGLMMISEQTQMIKDTIGLIEAMKSVPLLPQASVYALDTFVTTVNGYVVDLELILQLFEDLYQKDPSETPTIKSLTSCADMNGIYQTALASVCDDIHSCFAKVFEAVIILACLMFGIEWLKRLIRTVPYTAELNSRKRSSTMDGDDIDLDGGYKQYRPKSSFSYLDEHASNASHSRRPDDETQNAETHHNRNGRTDTYLDFEDSTIRSERRGGDGGRYSSSIRSSEGYSRESYDYYDQRASAYSEQAEVQSGYRPSGGAYVQETAMMEAPDRNGSSYRDGGGRTFNDFNSGGGGGGGHGGGIGGYNERGGERSGGGSRSREPAREAPPAYYHVPRDSGSGPSGQY